MPRLLERLALHRPELRAWALYDWANSAFVTIVMASVFPVFYESYANAGAAKGDATFRFSVTTAIAVGIIAVLAPVLGAVADRSPLKKKLLGGFALLGASATAAMVAIQPGGWGYASIVFVIASVGAMGSFVFYDALLPHIARDGEMDRVSTAGYALGYVGGGLLLVVVLVAVQKPGIFGLPSAVAATKASFVVVALWWLVFALPLFRRVPEPPVLLTLPPPGRLVRRAFADLARTTRELRRYRQAALFLLAFLVYNDGVGTIIKMAAIYGAEIDLPTSTLFGAIVLVQLVGIPFTFLFGQLAGKLGTKRSIFVALAVYGVVSVLGYFMTTSLHFYLLALLIGMVQGGVQALSRSLFASMIPRAKASEFFGLFAVFEKFAGVLGPLLFAMVLASVGSSRVAILAILGFFVVGAALLALVDVEEGQRAAREANAEAAARG